MCAPLPDRTPSDRVPAHSISLSAPCRLKRHALGALISEKRALVGCGEVVSQWLAKLEQGVALDQLYDWGDGKEDEWGEEEEEDTST
jgi:hypothetical protein